MPVREGEMAAVDQDGPNCIAASNLRDNAPARSFYVGPDPG
jgi:hypothetical protein